MGGNTMDEEDRDPNNLNQHLQVPCISFYENMELIVPLAFLNFLEIIS
jgi:hypothetical protein